MNVPESIITLVKENVKKGLQSLNRSLELMEDSFEEKGSISPVDVTIVISNARALADSAQFLTEYTKALEQGEPDDVERD